MAQTLAIFDLDGTLVDSEPIANRVFFERLAALGLDPRFDEARVAHDLTGLSLPSCFALVRKTYGIALPEDFEATLQAETYARFRRDLKPIPGAPELLEALQAPRCVASSSEPEKIALSLDLTGLRHHFGSNLFSARQVARGKPAPDLFLHAADRMGAAAGGCVVIEDSLPGATAGRAAGMTVYAYRPDPQGDAPFLALGCRLVRDLRDLLPVLAG